MNKINNQANIEPYGLIYKTTNLINNRIYIGKTRRIKDHFNGKYKGSGDLISLAFKKYCKENFKCEFICYAYSLIEINNLETYHIKEFNSLTPNGYNISVGGGPNTFGYVIVKDKNNVIFQVSITDPRYLSGELVSTNKGYTTVKDPLTNKKFKVLNNDPRLLSGEVIGIMKNFKHSNSYKELRRTKIVVKNNEGYTFKIDKNDPRYLSGELVGVAKNQLILIDPNTLERYVTTKDDPRFLSGELVGLNKNKAMVKDKDGNKFQVSIDDPRYLSGELVHAAKGYKHSEVFKQKMKGRKLSKETLNKLKGYFLAKDKDGNRYRITKDDPRWINKELVGIKSNYFEKSII